MLKNWFKLAAVLGMLATLVGCSATRAINALVPSDTYRLTPDVAYGPQARQLLDVYQPKGEPPDGGFPVVVFFYGGTWHMGERAQYRFMGEALAAHGMVAMVADYRLYPEATYPGFLPDCAKAVVYALNESARFSGNPRRVVVMGHSAGAYNAAMIALDPRWLSQQGHRVSELAGWIGLAGPYDFIPIVDPQTRETFHHPDVPLESQPIRHVSAAAPRTFLAVAKEDKEVNPERNSAQLAEKLKTAGVPVDLKRYDHVGHISLVGSFAQPLRWLSPALKDVSAFVKGLPAVAGRDHVKPSDVP
ncbi:alpha/beta hydrolase [Aquabacterium sp.]|uniref:alpha/beta hydrolase n=1 Tax=Aquabacterium sp. TaxID=1872578 RepID=UPI00199C7400|nr:alpha/beta hydrolase [Aquabacterium sp.]MBC7701719.1 alpha/beta hydrolase [Aquabacterium sp.]